MFYLAFSSKVSDQCRLAYSLLLDSRNLQYLALNVSEIQKGGSNEPAVIGNLGGFNVLAVVSGCWIYARRASKKRHPTRAITSSSILPAAISNVAFRVFSWNLVSIYLGSHLYRLGILSLITIPSLKVWFPSILSQFTSLHVPS